MRRKTLDVDLGLTPSCFVEVFGHAYSRRRSPWAPASYVPASGTWTHEWLVERLADAGDTLRRLPKPKGQERSLHAAWPEMLREWLAYGDETTQVKRARPHPQAITRLDEILEMLMWLTPRQRAVLWARHAERMTWPKNSVSRCPDASR